MGSIRYLSNRKTWQARYRSPDGRQRSRTFARKLDAQRFLTTVEHDKLVGGWVDPDLGKTTFTSYVDTWLASTSHLAPGTQANIAGRLANHLLPYFGPMPLAHIRASHVRGWIAEMIAKGLSPGTVNATYRTLGKILRTAEIDGFIARSPLVGIDLPTETARAEMVFLSAEEVASLAEAIEPRYRALIYTAAYTGMRWGELAALRIEHIDLLRATIHVCESLSEVNGVLHRKTTKTGKARTVSLPRFLAEMLGQHIGLYPSADGHVFSSAEGLPLRRRNFYRRHFRPAVDGEPARPAKRGRRARPARPAALPPDKQRLRFHDLRHTCAALLIAQGAHAKEIQERLGHSTIRLTFDRYGHLLPSLDERLRDRLEAAYRAAQGAHVEQVWNNGAAGGDVAPLRKGKTPG